MNRYITESPYVTNAPQANTYNIEVAGHYMVNGTIYECLSGDRISTVLYRWSEAGSDWEEIS